MKIVEKTDTKLHLYDRLGKREIIGIMATACWWSLFLVIACFEPTKMQLRCQKSLITVDCQITSWYALNLHSQTRTVQLSDVQLKKRRKQNLPVLLLDTEQGTITSPVSERAYAEEQQIRRFLTQPQPSNLQMDLTISRDQYLFLLFIVVLAASASCGQFLIVPVTTDWQFELDESELDGDRQRPSGTITGLCQGLLWKRNISREFSDVLGLDVKRTRRNSYAILSMYPGQDLRLSISDLSEPQWQEINQALSEILQIPPHQTLQEQLKPWFRRFRNLDRIMCDRGSK
jgi:hypothetical protein